MKSAVIFRSASFTSGRGIEKRRLLTTAFAVFFVVYAVISPKTVTSEVLRTAESFVRSALPSMLPFAIASGMLIKSGFGEFCERIAGRLFGRIFGLNGAFAAPFVLGALAGFPVGARAVCDTYGRGTCSKEEAEEALALCSNPGLGFTVAGVGGMMWNDTRFGVLVWVSCVVSSLTVGALLKPHGLELPRGGTVAMDKEEVTRYRDYSVSRTVTEAVTDAAETLLRVFAFVVFFKTVSAVFLGFTACLPFFSISDGSLAAAFITSFFEFSSGVSALASAAAVFPYTETLARVLTVAALSWSGMSVHMQTASFTVSCGISMKKYCCRKLVSAALATVYYLILARSF